MDMDVYETEESFDVSLPSKHTYLGDLREIHATPYFAQGSLVLLPYVFVPDVVLMPNQHIPINVEPSDLDLSHLLRDVVDVEQQQSRPGFVCMAADIGYEVQQVSQTHPYFLFGTIAAIVRVERRPNVRQEDEDNEGHGIKMIVKGCQRCLMVEVVSQDGDAQQFRHGRFRILPDEIMESPLKVMTPLEWRNPLIPSFSAAFLSPFSPALYGTFDTAALIAEIKKEIVTLQLVPAERCQDDTDFSYWLAASLPLPAHFRLQLLGACSTIHRLRSCLLMLRNFNRLDCAVCKVGLALKEDGIAMTRAGLTSAYMNPGGLTQEIFTVKKVSNVRVFGQATTQYTWFPGYAWRHLQCRGCHNHLGWRYDAVASHLTPKLFYGLRRADVVPNIQPQEGLSPQQLKEFYEEHEHAMMPVYYREAR